MTEVTTKPLAALRFDPKNARKHTQRNLDTIEKSLREVGAGRSLVAAADGTILAGNATLEAAGNAGFENAIVIETDGTQLVVIKRTDLAADDELATKLALYDNRAAEFAEWNPAVIAQIHFETPDITGAMFTEKEIDQIIAQIDADRADEAEPEEEEPLEQFIKFSFGEYNGRVSKRLYDQFVNVYEREKASNGYVMLDDVISALMGISV